MPVPTLRELQAAIRDAMLGNSGTPAAAYIAGDGLDPEARLQIYRHHVSNTITAALETTFPVVCRLVDRRFFAYAADNYLRRHPPIGPCLVEYGATFPEFLAGFPPCRGHAYLPDVARLEWAMNRAIHADDHEPLEAARLAAIPPDAVPRLSFRLHPSVSFVDSPWPIDRIWQANQDDRDGGGVGDLAGGGVHLEVRRVGGEATMRVVSKPRFAFRQALHEGLPLDEAASAALSLDPSVDLTHEIHLLLEEGLLIEFTLYSGHPPRGG